MIDNLSDEEKHIYQEVEKRKQRAMDLGLPKLISDLHANEILQYPDWIKNNHVHGYVCSLVTEAVRLDDNRATRITLLGREYTFKHSTHRIAESGNPTDYYGLQLFFDGKKVLSLKMKVERNHLPWDENDKFRDDWIATSFDIEAFIEGDWINDFQTMRKRLDEEHIERKRRKEKRKESPDVLNKLKEDFGIN